MQKKTEAHRMTERIQQRKKKNPSKPPKEEISGEMCVWCTCFSPDAIESTFVYFRKTDGARTIYNDSFFLKVVVACGPRTDRAGKKARREGTKNFQPKQDDQEVGFPNEKEKMCRIFYLIGFESRPFTNQSNTGKALLKLVAVIDSAH